MKVLIVDDQPMMLKTLALKFQKENYEVISCSTTVDALEVLQAQPIDVILTEVSLPGGNDFELLIAAKKKDFNIVVIILSIHSLEQTIIEAFELGAEEFFVKPVNLNLLSIRIKKLIKVKKMKEVLAKSIPASERQNILRTLSTLNVTTANAPTSVIPSNVKKTLLEEEVPNRTLLPTSTTVISEDKIPLGQLPKSEVISSPDVSNENDNLENEEKKFWTFKNLTNTIVNDLKKYIPLFIIFSGFILFSRISELLQDLFIHGTQNFSGSTVFYSFIKDLLFCLHSGFILCIPYFLTRYLINEKVSKIIFIIITCVLCIIHVALSQYFLTSLSLLGSDFWSYSYADIRQTVKAGGGIPLSNVAMFILFIALLISAFIYIPNKLKLNFNASAVIGISMLLSLLLPIGYVNNYLMPGKEYSNNLSVNKSWYFYNASWKYFFPSKENSLYDIGSANNNKVVQRNNISNLISYPDPQNYPFLHTIDSTKDVLSPFFDSSKNILSPNIVFIVVEGLGRAFSNNNAYLGSYTPFLDSLSHYSLYWENFLSEGGRTFAALPSIFGSLPYNKTGFLSMKENMPPQISLFSILEKNGYTPSFYYGSDSHFDDMDIYLKKNDVTNVYDQKTYPSSYHKMPSSSEGFSWGYGDKEMYTRYFETIDQKKPPFLNVLLTVSTHSPFLINDQATYFSRFESRIEEIKLNENDKASAKTNIKQYSTILYADDAIRGFFEKYKQRPDFANTIFIITGDHRMPEIEMSTKIDRYHVPLIIYSPLLKRSSLISSISTHFDITPSVTLLLHKKFGLQIPFITQWMGMGLDTTTAFRNIHNYPLKQVKNENLDDFISSEYFINDGNLFKISKTLDLDPISFIDKQRELSTELEQFKARNNNFIASGKLIPDTLAKKWGSK